MFKIDKIPKLKCGASVPTLLGINAGLSALGIGAGLASSSSTNSTNLGIAREQMDLQKKENEKNRNFNAEQSAIARAFAASQQEKANQFTTSERLGSQDFQRQQWAREAEWNTPTAQASRLSAAGFNPSVVLSNTSAGSFTGAVGAPQGASSPAASVAPASYSTGVTPAGGFAQMPPVANMLQAVGSFARDVSMAQKTGMDTTLLKDTFMSLVKKADLEAEGQSLENSLSKIRLQHEDEILVKKIQLLAEDIVNTSEDSVLKKSQYELNNVLEDLNRSLISKYGQEGKLLALEVNSFGQKLAEKIKVWRSEANKNNAQASESAASAEGIQFFNDLRKDPKVKDSLCNELIEAGKMATAARKVTESQQKVLNQQVEQLRKATDNYEIQMWSGIINQTIGTLTDAVGEFTRFGMVKKFMNSKPEYPLESGRGYRIDENGLLFKRP